MRSDRRLGTFSNSRGSQASFALTRDLHSLRAKETPDASSSCLAVPLSTRLALQNPFTADHFVLPIFILSFCLSKFVIRQIRVSSQIYIVRLTTYYAACLFCQSRPPLPTHCKLTPHSPAAASCIWPNNLGRTTASAAVTARFSRHTLHTTPLSPLHPQLVRISAPACVPIRPATI